MKHLALQLALLLAVVLSSNAEAPVKGTHVILQAPEGFVATDRFPGFMSEETGASIAVTELPASWQQTGKGFDEAGLKKHGMQLISREDTSFGERKGLLIAVSQSAHGMDFLKWLAVFGDDQTTYVVTASYPKELESELSAKLKQSVAAARVSGAAVDPMEALTFRITPSGGMKIVKVISNALLMSKDGVFPAMTVDTPIFIAAPSLSKGMNVPDRKGFAEARMHKITSVKSVEGIKSEPIAVDGLEGFESVASALDTKSGAKTMLYQVALFDKDGYYLMQGIVAEGAGAAQLPIFKALARSFKRVGNASTTDSADSPT